MKVPTPRKLPSGTWFARVRVNGQEIPITASTEQECKKRAARIKAEMLDSVKLQKQTSKQSITLSKAIDVYIARRDAVLSPSTIRGYRQIQNNRFNQYMNLPISKIKDWQIMVNDEAKVCSAKTLKNAWGLISSAVNDVTGEKLNRVKLPQIIPNEHVFFSPEEIKVFLKAIHGKRIELPALLALSSLRRSEILALRWENIDLDKRVIKIRGAAVLDESHKIVMKPENKNPSSTRDVPILIDTLYDLLQENRQEDGFVIQYGREGIRAQINKICEKNNLPLVGVHGLRHSFVSLAYHLGIPEKDVMMVGGWSDYQTMRKIYTHISKADTEEHLKTIRNFFSESA